MRAQSKRVRPVAGLGGTERREDVVRPRLAGVESAPHAEGSSSAAEGRGPSHRRAVAPGAELDLDGLLRDPIREEREVRHPILVEVGAGDEPSAEGGRSPTPGAEALAGRSGSDVYTAVPAS